MTPTDVLLASPRKEDENKKNQTGTFLPGGGLAVRGTMARHSYIILELYRLNIIVMKMQPVPSPILPLLPLLG